MTQHIVTIQDLTDAQIRAILDAAAEYHGDLRAASDLLTDRIVAAAFYEPSTRTRLSFEAAAYRLGASVIGFAEAGTTSSVKGETLEDTVRVLSGYGDLLVMRHPEQGAARRAADVSSIPVVNAGDGTGEHPTQTLLDLYTMRRSLGRLNDIQVAVMGDLQYGRTVHSLVPALHRMGAKVVQVPAGDLELPPDVGSVPVVDLETAAAESDVLYVTRVQKERMRPESTRPSHVVDGALLQRTRSKAIVMHPLPRVDEIAVDVDSLPSAKYFEQARNAVPVRMAVLAHLLGATP